MKRHLFVLLIVSQALWAQFDNVGTSVANFLKIGVGARGSGMGGAFSAQVDDASSMYWNPAGLGQISQPEIQINSTDWIFDVKHQFFSAAVPTSAFGVLGVSVSYLSMGDMLETTHYDPDGTGRKISASDLAIGLGMGKKISDRFSFGLHAKYIKETISFSSGSAIAVDIGTQYRTSFQGLIIGMSLSNFGSKMRLFGTDQLIDVDIDEDLDANPDAQGRLDTKDWPLPLVFRYGLSVSPIGENSLIKTDLVTGIINFEYIDPRDYNPFFVLGGEFEIINLIIVRSGVRYTYYKYDDSLDESHSFDALTKELGYVPRFSWGIGLNSKNFPFIPYALTVDYSSSNMGVLGFVSRVSLTLGI
ncbi:MAG: PorV/PorQ family protein [Candidatus Marinimicrobia bacterium]|nr:PorV/PorQ family protein [Candidatus Neomarinimicrobiota bacterium]